MSRRAVKLLVTREKNVTRRVPRTVLEYILASILKDLRSSKKTVELHLVRSRKMQSLNKAYRNKNRPTDILSFPSEAKELLGSLVIDIDTAATQAKEYRHSYSREILELFVHGVLHLLGYDHETPNEARVMKKLEERYQKRLEKWLKRKNA